ncbi:MAG: hypothetical protein PHW65_06905 [Dehalococcoidales bacterium]|nr:hypothetical protein [Dehalococcoidales bacterium]
MSEQKEFSTALTRVSNVFMPLIARQLAGNGIMMNGYEKQCVINAISAIHSTLDASGVPWGHPQLDQSNITQVLLTIACLKLNAAASPREVYFQLRNKAIKARDEHGKETTIWKKQIEMGIEGDGNDALLARFGRDVKKVGQFWLVREKDLFEYPVYNGLEYVPPKWTPTGMGEVIRVVYPIVKTDDSVEFYIAEREDVTKNLLAHINNNLMNETFGICADRYKATTEQKNQITAKKTEILKKVKELGFAALDDPELQQWVSPAWTEFHSREQMVIRKMRNNIVKKIPKDFGSAFIEMAYERVTDETVAEVQQEIAENANQQVIDVVVEQPQQEETPPEEKKQAAQNKKQPDVQGTIFSPTGTEGPGF